MQRPNVGGGAAKRAKKAAEGLTTGRRSATGPSTGRTRSWGLVSLAALLVLGLGLAVAVLVNSAGAKSDVLAVGKSVAKGTVIERGDLVQVNVAGVKGTVPVAQINTVVGQTAAVDFVPGQLVVAGTFTDKATPGPGEAVVGLSLEPSKVPGAGLEAGDLVDLYAVPAAAQAGNAETKVDEIVALTKGARVFSVDGDSVTGGTVLVTVVVPEGDAGTISAHSALGRVSVVETSAK